MRPGSARAEYTARCEAPSVGPEARVSADALLLLLVLMICGVITYVAFVNPPLGVAIGIGVAVAAFAWQILKKNP